MLLPKTDVADTVDVCAGLGNQTGGFVAAEELPETSRGGRQRLLS